MNMNNMMGGMNGGSNDSAASGSSSNQPMNWSKLGEMTGWQLALGQIELSGMMGMMAQNAPKQEEPDEAIPARPWFLLCLLLPIVGLVVAGLHLAKVLNSSVLVKSLLAVGAVGLVISLLAFGVNIEDDLEAYEKQKTQQERSQDAMNTVLRTETGGYLWAVVILNACLILIALLPSLLPMKEIRLPSISVNPPAPTGPPADPGPPAQPNPPSSADPPCHEGQSRKP
jgi:hypothetical protein